MAGTSEKEGGKITDVSFRITAEIRVGRFSQRVCLDKSIGVSPLAEYLEKPHYLDGDLDAVKWALRDAIRPVLEKVRDEGPGALPEEKKECKCGMPAGKLCVVCGHPTCGVCGYRPFTEDYYCMDCPTPPEFSKR